jgi:uncharacterized repeat protein (TIGR01451 family)
MHPPPKPCPAPVLYVRFAGTPGLRVTYYAGGPAGQELEASAAVGLRPGYIYRVKVTGFPDHPGAAVYPTLEVRGTLALPGQMRSSEYPAPVTLSEEDVAHALAGALVTKVVYLEHPDRARPVATRADQPLEYTLRPSDDPLAESRILGRPLLIVRLGGRSASAEELAARGIAGTVLLPGARVLPTPAVKPWVPWSCWPVYDPYAGPLCSEDECLRDGGDAGLPAGLDAAGNLNGLDPADTVAVYTDSKGQRHVAVSNPVCICVPRFAVLVVQNTPVGYNQAQALGSTQKASGQQLVLMGLPSVEKRQALQLEVMRNRERVSGFEGSAGLAIAAQLESRAVVVGRYQEKSVTGTCAEKPAPPDRPLILCKSADKHAAQIGEVVTFFLKYTNTGGQPINDVVISDSLTGRLEYVPGSAQADREAVFTMKENEAGSLVLRWQIGGSLLPGQSGVVGFQARIR